MSKLLHVTQALKPLYTGPVDPWYLDRGKAVHLACELLDTVGLDRASLDPQITGYVEAWERCKDETGIKIGATEQKIGGDRVGYIGTLDRIVFADGKPEIWDIKTGGPHCSHGLQLAAYLHGVEPRLTSSKVKRRICHLAADGSYKLIEHTDPNDLRNFMAFLAVAYFRINSGIDPWPAPREGEE